MPTPTTADIARAADTLRAGGLVAFPTETVYGLGADASSPAAVRRLFAVKGRPADHPVIVHLADTGGLADWAAEVGPAAAVLAAACWPGPLTLVVRRAAHVLDSVTGGLDTVGLRVPDQPVAQALLHEFGGGVAAPSANRFGRVSPTTADHVRADLGDDVDVVLDGGPCRIGVESTVVDCSGDAPAILRVGGVTRERIEEILGRPVALRTGGETRAPGTLAVHYAPRARVVIADRASLTDAVRRARRAHARVGVIAVAPLEVPAEVVAVSRPADAEAFAHDLYDALRRADACGVDCVVVVPPPDEGIGAAVVDRLRRAAAADPAAGARRESA